MGPEGKAYEQITPSEYRDLEDPMKSALSAEQIEQSHTREVSLSEGRRQGAESRVDDLTTVEEITDRLLSDSFNVSKIQKFIDEGGDLGEELERLAIRDRLKMVLFESLKEAGCEQLDQIEVANLLRSTIVGDIDSLLDGFPGALYRDASPENIEYNNKVLEDHLDSLKVLLQNYSLRFLSKKN